MTDPVLRNAFQNLAQSALELAEVCDRDIKEFALSWHRIASNARVLESADSVDLDDARSLLDAIRMSFRHSPGEFMEAYIVRSDPDEDLRENDRLDALKKQVGRAAAEVQKLMKIDPRSY